MKVKDLKKVIELCSDDNDVIVCDVNCNGLRTTDAWENAGNLCISTTQEFPDVWYDANGKEIDWEFHDVKRVKEGCVDEIYLTDKKWFGDDVEHRAVLNFMDGIAHGDGVLMKYPKVDELSTEQIRAIDEYCGGRIRDSLCITPFDVCLLYGKITFFGLMDTTNGHSPELVRRINLAWMTDKKKFRPVLCALYERDIDEITDADSFQIKEWAEWPENMKGLETNDWSAYNKRALEEMKLLWDEHAYNYLMHIADDGDLYCVLSYLKDKMV